MLYFKKLDPRAIPPTCAHPGEDAAFDVFALEDTNSQHAVPGPTLVRTGLALQYAPYGQADWVGKKKYALLSRDRSSMAKKGIYTHGGVIDASYTGEVMIQLSGVFSIKAGDKIAQLVPVEVMTGVPIRECTEMPNQGRGDAGFGSTGSRHFDGVDLGEGFTEPQLKELSDPPCGHKGYCHTLRCLY